MMVAIVVKNQNINRTPEVARPFILSILVRPATSNCGNGHTYSTVHVD